MNIIPRNSYAKTIDAWLGKGQIIVLIGQRRVGKSYIMKDFIARHKNEPDANIIYIDKEKKNFKEIRNHDDLEAYIDKLFETGKHNYILIDEIQDILQWEKSIRHYRTEENTDVIITGSNSKMLSGELGTLLGGRYQQILIQSLSYLEFLRFHDIEDNDESLWKFLNYGGLPGLRLIGLDNEEMVWDYLGGIFNTIMLKDVIDRHQIRNLPFLNNLIQYLADTIGKPNSANNIAKHLKSNGETTSTNAILNYISFFEEAYLISNVNRYDIHGKKLLETNRKIYFGDQGLRNYICGGNRENDIEKVIEDVVYQHLIRLGYKVTIGQLRVGEIDFVCSRHNNKVYIQVAYMIDSKETHDREFNRLFDIQDAYPKYVISASPLIKTSNENGVIHLSLRDFLKRNTPNL